MEPGCSHVYWYSVGDTDNVKAAVSLAPLLPAGFRIGKGEGYADLEYAMMAAMGAVSDSTVVVTIVHDCQVSYLVVKYCFMKIYRPLCRASFHPLYLIRTWWTLENVNVTCCLASTQCSSYLLHQVVNIPEELIESHDLTVDYILTPSQVIKTNCQHSKPEGIIWTKVHFRNFWNLKKNVIFEAVFRLKMLKRE